MHSLSACLGFGLGYSNSSLYQAYGFSFNHNQSYGRLAMSRDLAMDLINQSVGWSTIIRIDASTNCKTRVGCCGSSFTRSPSTVNLSRSSVRSQNANPVDYKYDIRTNQQQTLNRAYSCARLGYTSLSARIPGSAVRGSVLTFRSEDTGPQAHSAECSRILTNSN
jgi:hypothetical protein